jgi:glycosyltransferase involved in cell wall biosynthesis
MKVRLVTPNLEGLPGQRSYAEALARNLPGCRVETKELPRPAWATGAAPRTLAVLAAAAVAGRGDADLVHATDTFSLVRGADVVTIHDLIPALVSREPLARLHHAAFGRRFRHVPRVIVPTATWAGRVQQRFGIDAARIRVIPQGCDPQEGTGQRPPAYLEGRRHILVVGSYRPYKRLRRLIRAAAALREVAVVRVGPLDDGPYAQECRRLAERAGCALVDVGPVTPEELADHYAAADLLYYGSLEEGFGLPPLEAMAAGTSSLLSDIPVFREVYGTSARYVPLDGDLRRALAQALDDPLPPAQLRAVAATRTWAATARRTREVYDEALAAGGGKPVPQPSSVLRA